MTKPMVVEEAHPTRAKAGVQVLERAFDIIELLAARPQTAAGIAAELGLPRPTVYRVLATLGDRGIVHRGEHGVCRLGRRLFQLSVSVFQSEYPCELVRPLLSVLRDQTGEDALFWVREDYEAVCLYQVVGNHDIRPSQFVGRTRPLHAGASQKVLLAWAPASFISDYLERLLVDPRGRSNVRPNLLREQLDVIRSQGYAFADRELSAGARGIAAPVFNARSQVNASVGIFAPFNRLPESMVPAVAQTVVEIASRISQQLGYDAAPLRSNRRPTTSA